MGEGDLKRKREIASGPSIVSPFELAQVSDPSIVGTL